MKLIILRMCLNETYSEVKIGKYLSDAFPSPPIAFNFALEYAVRKVHAKQKCL
jgi:hypothetical protein